MIAKNALLLILFPCNDKSSQMKYALGSFKRIFRDHYKICFITLFGEFLQTACGKISVISSLQVL